MKKIVCDLCRNDIRYDGVRVRFKNIFAFFFRRVCPISIDNSKDRMDLCEKCFNKLRELITNPNVIQELGSYLRTRRRPATPSSLMPTPVEQQLPSASPPQPTSMIREDAWNWAATEVARTDTLPDTSQR